MQTTGKRPIGGEFPKGGGLTIDDKYLKYIERIGRLRPTDLHVSFPDGRTALVDDLVRKGISRPPRDSRLFITSSQGDNQEEIPPQLAQRVFEMRAGVEARMPTPSGRRVSEEVEEHPAGTVASGLGEINPPELPPLKLPPKVRPNT